ncbi:COX15/CtaA family protein [Pedobacter metabolipauper]|uniref:Cytochrome c oxidase assembly protein subunit 15 n=1 Tax=Pedobacter metabolipauper TaxID=425513 RepID=A0A4R6SQ37_9SPHI|nr:COX15/CtaA family protein [Pedobacter metabolipauper]TDQ06174.1 cytochrome c oxidase assembly protein subunit 15 [Pedobacter metabolipauper]
MKSKNDRLIATWLYFGAGTIIIQILLGGVTRLTGSGLSITEWKPLMGFIPPIATDEWELSFEKYKQIAQFKLINSSFTLEDYKSIYFWEWLHRNWARFMGLCFILPFFFLLIKRKISNTLILPIFVLFLLGLLQGAIGWIMVKSGLNDTNIRVNHIRLSIHFMAAILLLAYTLWIAFKLSLKDLKMRHRLKCNLWSFLLLMALVTQLFYGALMAGTSAALAAPTWPTINGSYIPAQVYNQGFNINHLSSDLVTIQFIHRSLAYLICILTILIYIKTSSWKINRKLEVVRLVPLVIVFAQCALGIGTLLNCLNNDYKIYAALHQFMGLSLFISILLLHYLNIKKT